MCDCVSTQHYATYYTVFKLFKSDSSDLGQSYIWTPSLVVSEAEFYYRLLDYIPRDKDIEAVDVSMVPFEELELIDDHDVIGQ